MAKFVNPQPVKLDRLPDEFRQDDDLLSANAFFDLFHVIRHKHKLPRVATSSHSLKPDMSLLFDNLAAFCKRKVDLHEISSMYLADDLHFI
jgi:hypothetical protein